MNTESEFQETTTNLSNIEADLDSSVQDHIKALTKLVRAFERASHHIEILTTAVEKKSSPRGLIPRVNPKVSDTQPNL